MWSSALDAIFTTLRYLAPATLLTLLWSQQNFIFKLLKYIDSAFRALLFTNEEQKQAALQWLNEYGPVRVDDLGTVWRHGWILCGVLDTALPGACAGHPPTSLSLKHAQTIADHNLGVEPVFSRQELESNDTLSKHQEWRLTKYIEHLRQAISKITPSVTKPISQKATSDSNKFILDYTAKGSGLCVAQVNNKMYFKIYPTSQQSLDPQEITITIKGPNDSYGMKILPPLLGKAQIIRQQLLGIQPQPAYTKSTLPLAYGTTYFRNYGMNDMTKTYHVPKTKYNIDIEVESTPEHAKVGYTLNSEGRYEISITSKGQHIVGSPYNVTSSKNIINFLEKDSFCLEDGEQINMVDNKSDRKVLVRIVDFVTEKMLLKENGDLEKISEEDAKYLMENDVEIDKSYTCNNENVNNTPSIIDIDNSIDKKAKFNEIANKVMKINKVCKLFYDIMNEKQTATSKKENLQPRQQDIPDVVNSTLCDATVNPYIISNKRDKVIVPENISVSLLTEKANFSGTDNDCSHSDINLTELKILRDVSFDDESIAKSSTNPFLNESINEMNDSKLGKIMGTFVTSEFETNKLDNEEIQDSPVKITVDNSSEILDSNMQNQNSDIDILKADRHKYSLFETIAEKNQHQDKLICSYSFSENLTKFSENECTNPFVNPQHQLIGNGKQNLQVTDFIIGAPVSLPPDISGDMKRSLPQEQSNRSLDIVTRNDEETRQSNEHVKKSCEVQSSPTIPKNIADNDNEDNKEMWDSAYVSIDENNTLLDSNNNDNILKDTDNQKSFSSHYLVNMGPAEKEIWENCKELRNSDTCKLHDECMNMNRYDINKSIFTPIIEENVSWGMKGITPENNDITETDPVTIAFAEINDLYNDYFKNTEISFTDNVDKENIDKEVELTSEYEYVKSASDHESDVIRHRKQSEGKISEIQALVTESVSVSQDLHVTENHNDEKTDINNKDQLKFGDYKLTNIVLEKKKYWDEKIRQIEANAEELRVQQRKRRLSTKQLRHNDSLSKRKGKQIVKKYLNSNEGNKNRYLNKASEDQQVTVSNCDFASSRHEENEIHTRRVKNWKTFWDNKLDTESKDVSISTDDKDLSKTEYDTQTLVTVKQEIPEEVFKAFETSPKRFFGTSREQILNKIDSFSGKPSAEESLITNNIRTYESGLVSSRISLFHNISQTEDITWARRKSQSMHNIHQQKDNHSEIIDIPDIDKVDAIDSLHASNNEKLHMNLNENKDSSQRNQDDNNNKESERFKNITLKEKRARVTDKFYTKSFDETSHKSEDEFSNEEPYVVRAIRLIDRPPSLQLHDARADIRKISSSKSEMDIFNKFTDKSIDEDFNKYKSCDELPKVSVKSFISLYEDVTKKSSMNKSYIKSPDISKEQFKTACSTSGTAATSKIIEKPIIFKEATTMNVKESKDEENSKQDSMSTSVDSGLKNSYKENDGISVEVFDKESSYISLSDIDLEIVDKSSDKPMKTSPKREIENDTTDYKSRFKLAKQYFQSLEELREVKKPKKLNECQLLLYNKSTESLKDNQSKHEKHIKIKDKNIKSHTMPSSEISNYWNQLQEQNNEMNDAKLVKISEKFHVEDLFSDVMEGRLSRQGSLRGIPHKKAVLEAFRSMENISDNKLSPYELAVSQLNDIGNENRVKNAQTYLNEYPYLPTTEPSKFHSRLDINASGLISFKELVNTRVRRNSVPDLRLNPSFTVEL
ncbi:putative leucine-rich repeat-containing protein DDB_G0290503 isoform X2 [Battus philenor]